MDLPKLIGILGGWSVIITALAAWINKLSTERMLSKWRRDEQATAERLREELATNRSLLDIATKSHGSGQDILQRKRVDAVGKLWNETIDLRTRLSAAQ
ncbi:MAG TPA: hypothetical protein VHU83_16190 [Bryobacteraceae bacterium]|jgi:ClpP class serine protease|nr:hypothetical protein [Bryobacteraceae bacterium]